MNAQDILRAKQRIEELNRQVNRDEAALEFAMKRLKEEFGFRSVEEAKQGMEDMGEEITGISGQLDAEKGEFEKFKEKLDG